VKDVIDPNSLRTDERENKRKTGTIAMKPFNTGHEDLVHDLAFGKVLNCVDGVVQKGSN
jgi:hypothetical protein